MSFNNFVNQYEKNANRFARSTTFPQGASVKELIDYLEANSSEKKIQAVTRSLIQMGADVKLIGLKEILIHNLRSSINSFTNGQLERAIFQLNSNDFDEYVDQAEEFDGDIDDDEDEEDIFSADADEEYENAVDSEDLINWLDEHCYPSAIIEVCRYLVLVYGYNIKGRTSHRRVLARLRSLDANCDLDFDELHDAIDASVEF